ncbi:hypothetical protein [[Scytonema hofmanni] UTEX B 1581]|uniref:hypothetical protein n=1 Tax=[Scytonema hofmanni] UTEX B 1581 TaxID=379535 RepID=UPI00163F717A|nr:hypothetical protein [[Scytonema hofmanni] UTEX B 1581]
MKTIPVILAFLSMRKSYNMHPLTQSLLFSLLLGIAGAFLGWGLSSFFQAIAAHRGRS